MKWVAARGTAKRHLLASFGRLAALGGLMTTATCTDANESLIIMQAQVADDMCLVSDQPDNAVRMAFGILDVALDKAYAYRLNPLVKNQLIAAGTATDIEPNRVTINAASIKIVPPPGVSIPFTNECAAEFDHPTAASLAPGDSRAVSVEAVRSCHAALFGDLFRSGRLNPSVADSVYFRLVVRMKGRHGGTDIESDPFEYPLKVCYGCLQTGFTGQYAAFNYPAVPACDRLAENPFIGNARCGLPAQDTGPILCCARNGDGSNLQCPGVPAAAAP